MKLLLCFTLIFVCCAVSADGLRLSEPVAKTAESETFGVVLDTSLPRVSLTELYNNSDKYLNKRVLVSTKVAKVCQKKGCFFIAQENGITIRVAFKDYGFFVPTDSTNKQVLLAGELIQKNLSAEQAEHFNSDLRDKSTALKAGSVLEIIAESVQIPLSSAA